MNEIAKNNRKAAFMSIDDFKPTRKDEILYILREFGPLTSREIEEKRSSMFEPRYFELNHVKPRLTELEQEEKVRIIGSKEDKVTKVKVAIYAIRRKNDE